MAKKIIRRCLGCESKITEEEYKSDLCKTCGKKFSALERREASRLKRLAKYAEKRKNSPEEIPTRIYTESEKEAFMRRVYREIDEERRRKEAEQRERNKFELTAADLTGGPDALGWLSIIVVSLVMLFFMVRCQESHEKYRRAEASGSQVQRDYEVRCVANGTSLQRCKEQYREIVNYKN